MDQQLLMLDISGHSERKRDYELKRKANTRF